MALADTYTDLDGHIAGLYAGKIMSEEEVRKMCEKAKEILKAESNVVPVRAPVTIVRPCSAGAPRRAGVRAPSAAALSRAHTRWATSTASSRTCWS